MENETNLNDVERFNGADVLKVMEMIKKPNTNFDRITASPEALAKWVCEITDFCDRRCSHCPIEEKCLYDSDGAGNKDNESLLLDWLNEESEE